VEKSIILTGFMGAGKSSVARSLAAKLGWVESDLDEEIEKLEGRSISAIFETDGESYFRSVETKTLQAMLENNKMVLATGGGVLTQRQNRELLSGEFVVNLRVDPSEALKRIDADSDKRPLARGSIKELEELYTSRIGFYDSVEQQVDTKEKTPEEVAEEILSLMKG
jgi:shikimate kinase